MAKKNRTPGASSRGAASGPRSGAGQTISIPLDSIAERTAQVLPGADSARLRGIQGLQLLRNARNTGDQRALAQLRKFGDNQLRVAELQLRIAANALLVRNLATEAERAATPPVTAAAGSYIVHGRIRDESFAGVPKCVVELTQTQGEGDNGPRSKPTDDTGYFKITVTGVKDPAAEAAAAAGAAAEATKEGKAAPAAASAKRATVKAHSVYLRVLKSGALVQEDARPLTPRSGQVDYVEIIVPAEK
ncbi:MAG TPA: hypothetical protein VGJ18_10155 [Gemmatimonadaceae bacterium]